MAKIKLIAFTDLHEKVVFLDRIKKVIAKEKIDLAVCTGDFTVFARNTQKVMRALDDLGVPVVLIHGNHEDEEEIVQLLPQFKNIHWAHERMIEVCGVQFFGFGGGGFSREEPQLELLEKQYSAQFDHRTVVLSHAPPFGTIMDQPDTDWHVGNATLTMLIKRRKPLLVLCGHIHEGFHTKDTIGATTIMNPGPDGEIITIEDDE